MKLLIEALIDHVEYYSYEFDNRIDIECVVNLENGVTVSGIHENTLKSCDKDMCERIAYKKGLKRKAVIKICVKE